MKEGDRRGRRKGREEGKRKGRRDKIVGRKESKEVRHGETVKGRERQGKGGTDTEDSKKKKTCA